MTDEERAAEAVYVLRLTDEPHDPWTLAIHGACYAGSWVKREEAEAFAGEIRRRFLLHVAAVRAEEREACAKVVREVAKRPRTDPDVIRAACAAFDEAEAAIRARGAS